MRAAGILSRNADVMCCTFHSSIKRTSSSSSSAMLGMIAGGGSDATAVSACVAESASSRNSRDRCEPCGGSVVVSLNAGGVGAGANSAGVSDDDDADIAGNVGIRASSFGCVVVSVALFFFIGIDGGGI